MQAEIITIGDELLIGMTVDTNSSWMAVELTSIGFRVHQITSVSDNKEHIIKAIDESMGRSELVLVTGGLGPTSDDITKQTIAGYFDSDLVLNDDVLGKITAMLTARGLEMNENNRRQALVPDKCTVLENSRGTAPGMLFARNGHLLVSMPGVPYEMKYIMETHVIPYAKEYFKRGAIVYRLVMTYGTFEAKLAEILTDFEAALPPEVSLAYLPTAGIIKLRITARAETDHAAREMVNIQVSRLRSIIPQFIYGYDGVMLEEAIGILLREKGMTISTAESCTGGNIARMITSVPGSSQYFRGSIVAYDNSVKISELSVTDEMLLAHGAVSEQVAQQMAMAIRQKFNTDLGVSVTGIAGPGGGTDDKPVGTVWIAVSNRNRTIARRYVFAGHRDANIRRSSLAALGLLRDQIISM